MRAKIQQNLRICKFYVEKVLGGIKVRYFLAGGSAKCTQKKTNTIMINKDKEYVNSTTETTYCTAINIVCGKENKPQIGGL